MGQGSGGGGIPGMGFLQMFTNMFNGDKGGGPGGQTPPGGSANPLFQSTPGYSQPIPLFGNMSDDDLTAFMANNGIRQPQGPPSKNGSGIAALALPKKRSYQPGNN